MPNARANKPPKALVANLRNERRLSAEPDLAARSEEILRAELGEGKKIA